jgi:hypothetical protein
MNITEDFKDYTYIDNDGVKKEICVKCGAKTQVPFKTHIDRREYYIKGAGQLCDECGKILMTRLT